jgi:hypothetical protein
MMKLTLEVPNEVLEAVKLPSAEVEKEFRKELALALYQRSRTWSRPGASSTRHVRPRPLGWVQERALTGP